MIKNAPLQWLRLAAEVDLEIKKIYTGLTSQTGGCTSCNINAAITKVKQMLMQLNTPGAKKVLAAFETNLSTTATASVPVITMHCRECLKKHLAAALSYGKEIRDGHGSGGTPDHRPDFAGEVINAEHHAITIDGMISNQLREFRHAMDIAMWTPQLSDLDQLRELWLMVDTSTT